MEKELKGSLLISGYSAQSELRPEHNGFFKGSLGFLSYLM
jgi:hypothetical protein